MSPQRYITESRNQNQVIDYIFNGAKQDPKTFSIALKSSY